MTNAERYLKDGVDIEEMAYDYNHTKGTLTSVFGWLRQQTKPQLTENEKAILRSIPSGFKSIMRNEYGNLKLITFFSSCCDFWIFNGSFQFIKDGDEYIIKELLDGQRGRDINGI